MFKLEKMGPVETATTAFGQGISVTPIQQITGVSAAINGGTLYKPYIVRSISEPETNEVVVLNEKKAVRKNIISEESSRLVRYALESVVQNGTGKNAYIENYRVGGKTGTAQKVKDGKYMVGNYIVSFIGFMPADDPKYVVYVAVDNPKGITQYGGTVSAPIAKNILLSIIDSFNLPKTNTETTREYTWLDTKYIKLPDITGMNLIDAKKLLKGFKIEYTGVGENIIAQMPDGNTFVKENSTVKLLLE